MEVLGLKNIPPFQTISRRVRELHLHRINRGVENLFLDIEGLEREYKDPQSSWTEITKGWEYEGKVHISLDAQNLLIQDWIAKTAFVNDSTVAKAQMDSIRDIGIFLQTARMIHSSMIPVIDTSKRKVYH